MRIGRVIEVSYPILSKVAVGYHYCSACEAETPEPTLDALVSHARRGDGSVIWPGEGWMPPGWERGLRGGLLCPDCVREVDAVLASRRPKQP